MFMRSSAGAVTRTIEVEAELCHQLGNDLLAIDGLQASS
jgi:hypothetical protein